MGQDKDRTTGEELTNKTAQTSDSPIDYQLLPLILDSLNNVIFMLEVEAEGIYRFSFTNKAFQVTTGLPVNKVIGSLVDDIIPEPSLSLVKEKYREAMLTGKQVSWVEVSEYPTGQKTGQVLVIPVFTETGQCTRLIGMVHDITEFKAVQERQEKLSHQLVRQNRNLLQFNYIVSHNLRAPVANALGLVSMLNTKPKESKEFDLALKYLDETVLRMDDILRDLTEILCIRDKKDVFVEKGIPLSEVVKRTLTDLEGPLLKSNASVELDFGPEDTVQGEWAYLHSIFFNLLSNAIKYRSSERLLEITVKSRKVSNNNIKVTVADNGSGFDAQKVKSQIFGLYKQFHPHSIGKGVGLFLVKTQVEAMGGNINVESRVGVGTSFSIVLPH